MGRENYIFCPKYPRRKDELKLNVAEAENATGVCCLFLLPVSLFTREKNCGKTSILFCDFSYIHQSKLTTNIYFLISYK